LRVTGDWRLYIAACLHGHKVAYLAEPLNGHRRHERSITSSLNKQRHANEVKQMQAIAAGGAALDAATATKAEKHLAHVNRYLGLALVAADRYAVQLGSRAVDLSHGR
jgi:hypothetical protein